MPITAAEHGPGPRMDEGLYQAYLKTDFHVDADPPACLHIGQQDAAFAQWLRAHGHRSAVLLTAWNPYSVPIDAAENGVRQAQIEAEAQSLGLAFVPARGADPDGEWPAEESLCLFDVSLEHIDAWMRRYEQNAVVRVDDAGQVSLYWHPDLREGEKKPA
ncbi:MAG TPA: DUF3293 domain-containing protein [Burkholderiales bacterium]|nr:DUF3293 domain-containing protein [Burkholderiales bacterium]